MKRLRFFLLMASLFVISSAFAGSVLSINDIKLKPGTTTKVEISLANELPVAGTNFEIYLPEGLNYVMEDNDEYTILTLERTYKNGSVDVSLYGNNLNVVLSNMRGKTIDPGNGVLLSFYVSADANAKLSADAKIDVKNVNITDVVDGKPSNVSQDDFQVNVNIYNVFSVSATSADEKMGSVTIEPSGAEVESGTTITAKATPVAGYEFVNWTAGETAVSTANPYSFELTATTALTANFKAIKYPVLFKNGEDVVKKGDFDYASEITAPETDPTKTGYTFLGWYNGETKFEKGATVPVDGVTYTAKWQINQYTITFDTDGGSEIAPITQDYNTAVTAPENPTKEGHTFKGWEPALPETMPAKDITLKAIWTINQYTITYYVNDVIVNTVVVRYGDIIVNYVPTLDDGMTFDGWTDKIPQTMPAHDLEIHGTASNTSTAIKNIMTSIEEGCNVYTDNGVLVKRVNSKAELSTLPTGKYIINGVKIVIKK